MSLDTTQSSQSSQSTEIVDTLSLDSLVEEKLFTFHVPLLSSPSTIEKYESTNIKSAISKIVKISLDDQECFDIYVDHAISKICMNAIIQYMNIANGVEQPIVPSPLRSKVMREVQFKLNVKDAESIKEIDSFACADFIDSYYDTHGIQYLYELIREANYFDIKCLLHLACSKVASIIKGKPLNAIVTILSDAPANTTSTNTDGTSTTTDATPTTSSTNTEESSQ